MAAPADASVGLFERTGTDFSDLRVTPEQCREMYTDMVRARTFDDKLFAAARSGKIQNYPPLEGQEAAQVASAHALQDVDWVLPTYRDHAAQLVHGMPMEKIVRQLGGDAEGNAAPDDVNVFPYSIPIGSHIPHATGIGWAAEYQDDDSVALCYFGDGATSTGDFHEGLNMAGVFDTPTVFLCQNNQYAISVPRERQTAAETLAQKADAYGIDGVRIDGMDPITVYEETTDAVEQARAGASPRPTLIEAAVYRFKPHTQSDDPSRYRDEDEVAAWREYDPVPRFETYLLQEGVISTDDVEEIKDAATEEVQEAMTVLEDIDPDPEELFRHVYEDGYR